MKSKSELEILWSTPQMGGALVGVQCLTLWGGTPLIVCIHIQHLG